jgi:hypothetical protein
VFRAGLRPRQWRAHIFVGYSYFIFSKYFLTFFFVVRSVFRADHLQGLGNGAPMAVKRLDPASMQGQGEFLQVCARRRCFVLFFLCQSSSSKAVVKQW